MTLLIQGISCPGELNYLSVQVYDDEGIQDDRNNAKDYNIFGGSIDIDIHRLIAAGELGASELTRECCLSALNFFTALLFQKPETREPT